jgi:hypothetical protein
MKRVTHSPPLTALLSRFQGHPACYRFAKKWKHRRRKACTTIGPRITKGVGRKYLITKSLPRTTSFLFLLFEAIKAFAAIVVYDKYIRKNDKQNLYQGSNLRMENKSGIRFRQLCHGTTKLDCPAGQEHRIFLYTYLELTLGCHRP